MLLTDFLVRSTAAHRAEASLTRDKIIVYAISLNPFHVLPGHWAFPTTPPVKRRMSDLLRYVLSQQEFRRCAMGLCSAFPHHSTRVRARLPSLFSDFTAQRQTNPNGYTVNVQSWEEVLCKASKAGLITGQDGSIRRLSLEIGSELLQRLESKEWGRPLALNAVIVGTYWLSSTCIHPQLSNTFAQNEAVAQGRMVSSRAFMSSPNSIYSRSWAHSPWRLVSWGLEQIGLRHQVITTDMWTPRDFVLVRNVEVCWSPRLILQGS